MGKGLSMNGSSFGEPEELYLTGSPVVVPITPPPAPMQVAQPDYGILSKGLELAQLTFPGLSMADQTSWLLYENTAQLNTMPNGHFNIRLTTNPQYGPSVFELLKGQYSLKKHERFGRRTHLLHTNTGVPRDGTTHKVILNLFMIDLQKAVLYRDLATEMRNKDGTEYLQFDPFTPGVERFSERLRIR